MLRWIMLLLAVFTLPVHAQERCFPMPRLTVDEQGEVLFTDGSPLNVRGGAGRNFEIVATLPEGRVFDVVEGPVCADGINWFRIESPHGWIAESTEEDGYFVTPVQAGRDEMNTQFENAPLFDLAQADENMKVITRDNNTITVTNREGETLISAPITGVYDLLLAGIGLENDDEQQFWTFEGESFTFTPPAPPEADMELVSMAIAPDGTQAAWLFANCQNVFGCMEGTGYAVVIQDRDSGETREVWRGAPEIGRYYVNHWREDAQAVLLRLDDEAAYPEPGTSSGTDIGYPPEGRLIEIDLATGDVIETYQYRAVSATGKWRVFGSYESITVEGEETYAVNEETTSFGQFRFSPDESQLVWTETHYDNYERDFIDLKVMDLETGSIETVFTFADNYPFILSWLGETLIRVQVEKIEYTTDYYVMETVEHDLVFDVSSGDFWRLDVQNSWLAVP